MKNRLKNRVFLAALSALVYKTYSSLASQYGLPNVSLGDWQLAVDMVMYLIIGNGVYQSFDK